MKKIEKREVKMQDDDYVISWYCHLTKFYAVRNLIVYNWYFFLAFYAQKIEW